MAEGTEIHALSITLLWNADEDLDVTFYCDEQTTINSSNKGGKNDCRAKLDIEKNEKDFDSERGDGSFGQTKNIGISMPTDETTYTG